MGVQSCLDGTHRIQLYRISIPFQIVRFHAAHAMFRADRTVKCVDQIMHGSLDHGALTLKIRAALPLGGKDVVMQIAIAQMPESS